MAYVDLGMEIGKVLESSFSNIHIKINNYRDFINYRDQLQVGKYLKIQNGSRQFTVVNIFKITSKQGASEEDSSFYVDTTPVGSLDRELKFLRGTTTLPVPTEIVYVMDTTSLSNIFSSHAGFNFPMGRLAINNEIELNINANNFLSKHIAIVGSTGSGKSCTVAKILHTATGIANGKNLNISRQRNSHIIIFDLHSEYKSAFKLAGDQNFNLNVLDANNLVLPYWLMNADELESMFIDHKDVNAHTQRAQFRNAVILNKEKYNPGVKEVNYDTPVYFSIREVTIFLSNLNNEVIGKLEWENQPKLENGSLVLNRAQIYFDTEQSFAHTSDDPQCRAVQGPFHGEFDKFMLNMRSKISDKRLSFMFDARKRTGEPYNSADFELIIKQFLGYYNEANVSIVDLSGIPFEVLNITVSLISRIVFDFCFHLSKLRHFRDLLSEVPVLIVCEEAHNYVPRSDDEKYKASRNSLEKIVKEGRKYGLSLMVVSQRPSEVSETILAQCNNFIALRLTNSEDQKYVKRLMADVSSSMADVLPNLAAGEFLMTGDAVLMPCVVKSELPNPEPQSRSVDFYDTWQEDWKKVEFDDVIKRWRKELKLDSPEYLS